jgi:CelD/BcsL family acetyltransferase involved in cellulose biosynthesis
MCRNGISRAVFAQHEGRDIGFVMGGVDGVHYRGQQFSYLEEWAQFSVGNLLQWEQIQWLCAEGIARYDMGSVLEYKTHWAEIELQSQALVWRPIR